MRLRIKIFIMFLVLSSNLNGAIISTLSDALAVSVAQVNAQTSAAMGGYTAMLGAIGAQTQYNKTLYETRKENFGLLLERNKLTEVNLQNIDFLYTKLMQLEAKRKSKGEEFDDGSN